MGAKEDEAEGERMQDVSGEDPGDLCPSTPEAFSPTSTRNFVVTGGSSGIGRFVVEKFAKRGHNVLFSFYRNEDGAEQLRKKFCNVTPVRLDQGSLSSIEEFSKKTAEWLTTLPVRHLDGLVNNAALGSATVKSYCSEGSTEAERDEALMRVNSLGPLWLTRALLPLRKERMRTVVTFVGSVGGGSAAVFPEYHAADLMSKAAVTYLAKHLAAEHVHTEVDIICIAPGATETDMFRRSTLDLLSNPTDFVRGMPKARLIQPQHVADNIYHLSTAAASRMFHGAVIDASMGLAVRPGLQTDSNRT